MSDETDSTPTVACTLTPDQIADRTGEITALRKSYREAEERADGYTIRFDGDDEAFEALAEFVADERQCCSFAEYRLETTPPYEETRLIIAGPDGTKTMFGDGLIELLSAEPG